MRAKGESRRGLVRHVSTLQSAEHAVNVPEIHLIHKGMIPCGNNYYQRSTSQPGNPTLLP